MKLIKISMVFALLVAVSACQTLEPKDYSAFREADPHSILIVPVINDSVEVSAPDVFLSTLSRGLAEKGYYVFPVNLVKQLMEAEGMGEAHMVHEADPTRLGELFGSDMALYVKINTWTTEYLIFAAQTTVDLSYELKDTRTGQSLWTNQQTVIYAPQSSSSGHPLADLIIMAAQAAATKAAPNYIPLAYQANTIAFTQTKQGIPAGPYSPNYQNDMSDF